MSEKEYQILVNDKVPAFSGRYHTKVARQHQKKLRERIEPLIGEKCYLHTFHCAKCGAAVRERLYPLTILQYSYAKCQNCDAQYELYPGEIMLRQYEPVFSKLLGAVWGTGVGAHALLPHGGRVPVLTRYFWTGLSVKIMGMWKFLAFTADWAAIPSRSRNSSKNTAITWMHA